MSLNKLKTHIKSMSCVFLVFCLSLLSFSGCGQKNDAVVQCENHKLEAGEYAILLTQCIVTAQSQLMASAQTLPQSSDMSQMISEGKINDQPAAEWIQEQSTLLAKRIVAVRAEFDKLGLSISDEDKKSISDRVEKTYEQADKYYSFSKLGVSKECFQQFMEDQQKFKLIADEYFGEGKPKAIPNETIDEYTRSHGLKYKLVCIDKLLPESSETVSKMLKNASVSTIKDLVNKYMNQLANGKSIDDINTAYNKATEHPESALEFIFQYDDMDFIEKQFVLDIKPNSPATLKEDEYAYYIIQRFDVDPEYVEKQREMSKSILLSTAFEELLTEIENKYDIKVNQKAIDGHSPVEQAKIISDNLPKESPQQQEQNPAVNQEQNPAVNQEQNGQSAN